jgi:lysozyme
MNNLIENIKKNEGFVGTPYNDSLGIPTIGYGTKLPLSKREASVILEMRLKDKIKEIEEKEPFVNKLPDTTQEVIAEMCYQIGVNGVLKFKKMWSALKNFDFVRASEEMIDSRWAKQTPKRALELSEKMKNQHLNS